MLTADKLETLLYINDVEGAEVCEETPISLVIYNLRAGRTLYRLYTKKSLYEEWECCPAISSILRSIGYEPCYIKTTSGTLDLLAEYKTLFEDTETDIVFAAPVLPDIELYKSQKKAVEEMKHAFGR